MAKLRKPKHRSTGVKYKNGKSSGMIRMPNKKWKYADGKTEGSEPDVIVRLRSEGRNDEADAMLASMRQAEQLRKRNFRADDPAADYALSLPQQELQILMQNVKKNEDRKSQMLKQVDHTLSNQTSNAIKNSFAGLQLLTDSMQQGVTTAKDVADIITIQAPIAILLEKEQKAEEFARHAENVTKALELMSAAYGASALLGRGSTYLAETGISPRLFEMYANNPNLYNFVKNMDKGQVFANTVGGLADGFQSYFGAKSGNTAQMLINGGLVPFDAIGAAGGLNLNKYVPRSSKLRPLANFLDTAADRIGFGAMGYDIVDANDAITNALLQRFFEQPVDKKK